MSNPIELIFGLALVALLAAVAVFYGWHQRHTLSLLRQDQRLSPHERGYLLGQVRRRTLCCILLALFAAVLVGWFFMEGGFLELKAVDGQVLAEDEAAKDSLWFYTGYWIFAMVLLMVIMGLAAADLMATARYGLKKKRKLQDDHHALLALEAAKLRQKRQDVI